MTAKRKSESVIQKIIAGIIITVGSALIIAWLNGAFDSNSNTNQPPKPMNSTEQEAAEAVKGRG
jgi:hypothetical protein